MLVPCDAVSSLIVTLKSVFLERQASRGSVSHRFWPFLPFLLPSACTWSLPSANSDSPHRQFLLSAISRYLKSPLSLFDSCQIILSPFGRCEFPSEHTPLGKAGIPRSSALPAQPPPPENLHINLHSNTRSHHPRCSSTGRNTHARHVSEATASVLVSTMVSAQRTSKPTTIWA